TWATVGSCAQIGKNCHISGGTGIGGVLEPLQAGPVIIEDRCFIGARSEVAEGAIVREGAVLAMGVFIGASTRIIDRATGETFQGEVPPYSVVVPGAMPGKPLPDGTPGPALNCAVIVKRVDEKKRANDRGLPAWWPASFFIIDGVLGIADLLGFDPMAPIAVVFQYLWIVCLAILIADLGFRRGTAGPNRNGPDPLAGGVQ